jgi:hypothetical protein
MTGFAKVKVPTEKELEAIIKKAISQFLLPQESSEATA